MTFTNSEKFDMLECFIQCNNNSDIASDMYLNSYPERRQPHKSIYNRLKQILLTMDHLISQGQNITILMILMMLLLM